MRRQNAHVTCWRRRIRSAEQIDALSKVEYYMQQVRAIVQRVRQTHRWSALSHDRLRIYLSAWTLLAIIVLMARYFFQGELESALVALVQRPVTSLLVQHAAPLIAACFAGALGGAVGALLTMRVHAQKKYGFFDRKYGLRGLILPVIGAVVGMAIATPYLA